MWIRYRRTLRNLNVQRFNLAPFYGLKCMHNKLEGARESAYLRQVSFCRVFFEKILRGHVQTVSGNMCVKFKVRSFNRFKLIWLTGPLCAHRQTDRHTCRTNTLFISAVHSIHLTEIINNSLKILTISVCLLEDGGRQLSSCTTAWLLLVRCLKPRL